MVHSPERLRCHTVPMITGPATNDRVGVINDTAQQHADYSFSLDPYKMTELGIVEMNWQFEHVRVPPPRLLESRMEPD